MEQEDGFVNRVTDEDIKKAKEENPNVVLNVVTVNLDDGQFFEAICKQPTAEQFQMYMSMVNRPDGKADAGMKGNLMYVKQLLISPSFEKFSAICEVMPALVISIGNEMAKGLGFGESKKKAI